MTMATFNYLEAGLWVLMALVVSFKAIFDKDMAEYKSVLFFLSFWLVLFGISDVIEARTGAWWEPLGLLAFKAVCVTGLAYCFVCYYHLWKTKT